MLMKDPVSRRSRLMAKDGNVAPGSYIIYFAVLSNTEHCFVCTRGWGGGVTSKIGVRRTICTAVPFLFSFLLNFPAWALLPCSCSSYSFLPPFLVRAPNPLTDPPFPTCSSFLLLLHSHSARLLLSAPLPCSCSPFPFLLSFLDPAPLPRSCSLS